MTPAQFALSGLYYGPFRRAFRAAARSTVARRRRVVSGRLAGARFFGNLSQTLGVYELPLQDALLAYLKPGDTFYDVGANTGYFTLLAARVVGPQGRVIAFEPLPENLERLHAMLAENGTTSCRVVEGAVSDREGMVELFTGGDGMMPSLVRQSEDRSLRVPAVTLDKVAAEHPRPAVIKVDVEGAEALVLAGAQSLLAGDDPPVLLIELHSPQCDADVRALLEPRGFRIAPLVAPAPRRKAYPALIVARR